VIGGSVALIIINAIFFSFIFWMLTFIFKFYYSNKTYNYKLNFYECGFKSLTNVKVQYTINFALIMLFLLIYDGEFLILVPLALNVSLLNINSLIILIIFIIFLILTLVIDYVYNALEWQN
jgi:NADH:ubiquinone oxidoreductase subunit 3 (subunit A)